MILLEKVRNFMESRIILTGAELDVFTQIHRGMNTAPELAANNNLDLRALTRLLDAIVVYGFLSKENGRYQLMPDGLLLSADHPESTLPMVLHMNELWDSWTYLTEAVIQGKNPEGVPRSQKPEEATTAFIGAMHVAGRGLSQKIANSIDLSSYHKLLDVGGASGTYTIAFLNKNPNLKSVIFDFKGVIPLAEKGIREAGLAERVEFFPGDFYADEFPKGCDLALLSAIIHQNSPEQNLMMYGKIFRALEPGGTLIIRDHIMEGNRTRPPAGAIFALNMLVNTEGGDTYTFEEIKSALEASGFVDIRQIQKGENMDCIVAARKFA